MRKKKVVKTESKSITRFNPKPEEGLKTEQVKKHTEQGLVNVSNTKSTKTIKSILMKNIFTFFNMICLTVALALIFVGAYTDLTFLIIVIINTIIGIVQEIKAKNTMDKLSLTNSNFTFPNPENHNTSSVSKSRVPAVSTENEGGRYLLCGGHCAVCRLIRVQCECPVRSLQCG